MVCKRKMRTRGVTRHGGALRIRTGKLAKGGAVERVEFRERVAKLQEVERLGKTLMWKRESNSTQTTQKNHTKKKKENHKQKTKQKKSDEVGVENNMDRENTVKLEEKKITLVMIF